MSGVGNTTSGATIFADNTTSGGPNDVTVANLRVQQDMRVDGNFEVGTFSIDDLTVNDDLNITDQLTVGGNTYAQYLETALDVNCHGDVLVDQTIVCAGLASLNGGADMPPTKRLRVGSTTVNAEVNETDVTVTDTSGEGSLFHNRIHLSDPTNTHIARVRLNGSTMEVGPSTATTLALQTGGTTRATVNATTGQVSVTNGIASTSSSTGALILTGTGGAGIAGNVNIGGYLNVGGQVRGVWTALQENVALATTPTLTFASTNIRSIKYLVRGASATVASSFRLALKASVTALTHDGGTMGQSSTTAWPTSSIHLMAFSAGADVAHFTINIDYGGYNGANYVYNVSGWGYNGTNCVTICGQVYGAPVLDNTIFSTSTGSIDAGSVSTYVTYY